MFQNSYFKPATPAQLDCLRQLGCVPPIGLSAFTANGMIRARQRDWGKLPPTNKQAAFLRNRSLWKDGMNRAEASRLIAKVKLFKSQD